MGATWKATGRLLGGYLEVTWAYLEGYLVATGRLLEGYLEATWRLLEGYLEATWRLLGGNLGATWGLLGSYLEAEEHRNLREDLSFMLPVAEFLSKQSMPQAPIGFGVRHPTEANRPGLAFTSDEEGAQTMSRSTRRRSRIAGRTRWAAWTTTSPPRTKPRSFRRLLASTAGVGRGRARRAAAWPATRAGPCRRPGAAGAAPALQRGGTLCGRQEAGPTEARVAGRCLGSSRGAAPLGVARKR